MAIARVITKRERDAEMRSRFRIVCTGVPEEVFVDLLHAVRDQFDCKTLLRNPFPGQFDSKAVHEIITYVTGSAVGGYAAKQAIDAAKELFVAYMKFKFMNNDGKPRGHVALLYGPDNEVLFERKDKKKSKKLKGAK